MPLPATSHRAWLCGVGALLILASPVGAFEIHDAYARISPGGRSAAAYLTVTHHGPQPDRILAIHTEIAARAELHEHVTTDGIVRMRHLAEGVPVGVHETLVFEPGGRHMMLMGLETIPEPGESFDLTLELMHGNRMTVPVTVVERHARPPKAGHNH